MARSKPGSMLRGQPEPIRWGDLILVASLLEATPQLSASAFPGPVLGDQGAPFACQCRWASATPDTGVA